LAQRRQHTHWFCSGVSGSFIVFSLFFCLDAKEPKGQGCMYFAKIILHSAKEKELASLKQLFLFNASLRIISLRKIHEAGLWLVSACFCGVLGAIAFALLGFMGGWLGFAIAFVQLYFLFQSGEICFLVFRSFLKQ
jgi:hypothetical protein